MRHCKMTAGTRRIGRSKAAERLPEERPPEDAPRIAAAPVLEAEEFGHPVFGLAPVIAVGVARLTYQSGDVRTRPFAEPLGTLRPEELADPSVIGSHFGPGRYRLNPIGAGGRLVAQPQVIDCRGEDGTVPLVAEMPGAPVVAAAGAAPVGPAQPTMVESVLRELLADQKEARRLDMQTFGAMHSQLVDQLAAVKGTTASAAPRDDAFMSYLAAQEKRASDEARRMREELDQLRLSDARRSAGGGDSGENFLERALEGVITRFGVAAPAPGMRRAAGGGAAAPAAGEGGGESDEGEPEGEFSDAGGVGEEGLSVPAADEFRMYVATGGQVPKPQIRTLVKLHRVGVISPELWEVVEPIAEAYGLLTGG